MYLQGRPYFITNRVAEGLPFLPSVLMNSIIEGILARALELTPEVKLCALQFMGNHYHAVVLLLGGPECLSSFMNFFHGELARTVNALAGRRNRNVWEFRGNPQILLTPESVLDKIAYCYANPLKANLCNDLKSSKLVSSYRFRHAPRSSVKTRYLSSSFVRSNRDEVDTDAVLNTAAEIRPEIELTIEPFIWKDYFKASKEWSNEFIASEVDKRITPSISNEDVISEKIGTKKISNKNRDRVSKNSESNTSRSMNPAAESYRPKSYSSRKYNFISTCNEAANEFKSLYDEFCSKCKACWKHFIQYSTIPTFPPSAFLPPMLSNSNIWRMQT